MTGKRFFRISAYIFAVLIVTELAMRFILPRYFSSREARVNSSPYWRIAWIGNYLKTRVNVSDRIIRCNGVYCYHPTRGWDLKPDSKVLDWHQYLNEQVTISVNSKGLRGIKEYPYDKPTGTKRILVIGDSFTFGSKNNDREIFPHLLDEMMPRTEVLNLGVGGYGHDQILLRLKEEGVKYSPDIVMLFFIEADVDRNLLTFRDYAKPRYVLRNDEIVLENIPVSDPEEIIAREKFKPYLIDFLRILTYLAKDKKGLVRKEKIRVTKAIMKEMRKVCEGINARFVVAGFAHKRKLIKGIVKDRAECLFLDIEPWRYQARVFSGHWNSAGHKLVAKEIFKGLLIHKLILPRDIYTLGY